MQCRGKKGALLQDTDMRYIEIWQANFLGLKSDSIEVIICDVSVEVGKYFEI